MIEWLQLQQLDLAVGKHQGEEPMPSWLFYTYIGVSMALVTMAGLMSGLTLGLMSLDELDLEVLKRSGTEQEKHHARRIMPVIANEHFLLVTLLLFNALSTEALPIFLDRLVDPVTAVVLSVTVVLVIGEILPQAVCRSYGLQVGSYSAWFVRLLMALSSPVSWPIGKLLDSLLGEEHSAFFRRAQLKALVGLHSSDEGLGGTLSADEISIITGALDLTSKTAWAAMTPLDKVFMLPSDRLLDESTLQEILINGHSRIPLHEPGDRTQLLGLILVKELVLVDPEHGLTAGQLVSRQLPRLPADTPLYQLLRLFEAGGSHMVALTKPLSRGSLSQVGSWQPDPLNPLSAANSGGVLSPAGPKGAGVGGAAAGGGGAGALSRPVTPSGGLPRIKSGVIKAGDNMIYVEAQQQGPQGLGSGDINPRINPMIVGSEPEEDAWGQGREGDPVGIITIEDVIEELLQQEIIDETDLYVDNMQVTRVDAYALTTSLPPRLRKAYAQQFTPRVGRLVAHHHQHHHHTHPGSSWPHSGNAGGAWMQHHGFRLYEAHRTYSQPTTPLTGSPPGGHYMHAAAPQPPAAAEARGSTSSAGSMVFKYAISPLSPEKQHAQQQHAQQQQGQQLQGQQLLEALRTQQQQQTGPQTLLPQQQTLIRRHSAETGYMTYTIASLGPQPLSGPLSGPALFAQTGRRRASDQGDGSSSGHGLAPHGSTHSLAPQGSGSLAPQGLSGPLSGLSGSGGYATGWSSRQSSEQGEGSNHRRYGYFQAVREGVVEGVSSSSGGGSGCGNDLQQPLLGDGERGEA